MFCQVVRLNDTFSSLSSSIEQIFRVVGISDMSCILHQLNLPSDTLIPFSFLCASLASEKRVIPPSSETATSSPIVSKQNVSWGKRSLLTAEDKIPSLLDALNFFRGTSSFKFHWNTPALVVSRTAMI